MALSSSPPNGALNLAQASRFCALVIPFVLSLSATVGTLRYEDAVALDAAGSDYPTNEYSAHVIALSPLRHVDVQNAKAKCFALCRKRE